MCTAAASRGLTLTGVSRPFTKVRPAPPLPHPSRRLLCGSWGSLGLTRRLAGAQDDISSFDYVVAMDEGNHNELHLACRAWGETFAQMALTKVKLLGSYASYRNHLDPLNRPNGERLSLPEAASFIGAEVSPTAALLVLSIEGSVC